MKRVLLPVCTIVLSLSSCSFESLYMMRQKQKVSAYEQIGFNSMVERYFSKDRDRDESIEGIYSVSSLITKKGKGLLASEEKEKVVERKENYSKVAIIRDKGNPQREFLEVPIDKDMLPSYSIRGEFTGVSDGNILVYKHFEPRGKVLSYTFAYDDHRDILEGVRTENSGSFVITYKLTYLKLFPKGIDR